MSEELNLSHTCLKCSNVTARTYWDMTLKKLDN